MKWAKHQKNHLSFIIYLHRQKSSEHVWEEMLEEWGNGERNIKLNQAEFIDMGPLSKNSRFNIAACGVRKGSHSLVVVDWNMGQKVAHSEQLIDAIPLLV